MKTVRTVMLDKIANGWLVTFNNGPKNDFDRTRDVVSIPDLSALPHAITDYETMNTLPVGGSGEPDRQTIDN